MTLIKVMLLDKAFAVFNDVVTASFINLYEVRSSVSWAKLNDM